MIMCFCFHSRWRSREGQAQHHGHPEASLRHERQHLPPAQAHMERRVRGLAFLLGRGTTIVPEKKASKFNASWFRRFNRIVHKFRSLFFLVSSGFAATAIDAQKRSLIEWRGRWFLRWQCRKQSVRTGAQKDACFELHEATRFERWRQESAPGAKSET